MENFKISKSLTAVIFSENLRTCIQVRQLSILSVSTVVTKTLVARGSSRNRSEKIATTKECMYWKTQNTADHEVLSD